MNKSVKGLPKFLPKQGFSRLNRSLRVAATLPIVMYQHTLSFDHGPMKALYPYGYCQFHPSCSEYCRRSILKDGVLKGSAKGAWRIVRCNPFSEGGVDEP